MKTTIRTALLAISLYSSLYTGIMPLHAVAQVDTASANQAGTNIRQGGRLVLVEYRREDPNVPIKLLHKMAVVQVQKEIRARICLTAFGADRLAEAADAQATQLFRHVQPVRRVPAAHSATRIVRRSMRPEAGDALQ